MPGLIIKSNIKKSVEELQKGKEEAEKVSSVADEVGMALDRKVEDLLAVAVERAKANKRKTLQARDL